MPRKIVARTARETPEMRALRAAVLEELSAPLIATGDVTEAEARRQRKRDKRFNRDLAEARGRWESGSAEWRASQRERWGIGSAFDDADSGDMFAHLSAFGAERERDEAKAEKLRANAEPVVTVSPARSVPAARRTARPAELTPAAAPPSPAPRKRAVKAGVAGYVTDWRFWDET